MFKITRTSIYDQVKAWCEANGHTFETGRSDQGAITYVIDGEALSPGDAADKYLPGGFAGNFGR